MGLLTNPLRPRDQRLPLYRKIDSPTKERYSDDEYESYSSEDDSEQSYAASSSRSSRDASDPVRSGRSFLLSKRRSAPPPRKASIYPYRLPTRVSRYFFFGVAGILLLMILSLVRASQVENWKVAHGKVDTPPPPPPLWEKFPFLERYYGGIRTLKPLGESGPEYPSSAEPEAAAPPEHGSDAAQRDVAKSKSWQDYPARNSEPDIQECFLDAAGKIRPPPLRYYEGRPTGFPQNVVGSHEVLKLPKDICFERFGRYGPYGFGYSIRAGGLGTGEHGESEGSAAVWGQSPRVDFRNVDWADVQRRCFRANADRFNNTEAGDSALNKTDTTRRTNSSESAGADAMTKKQVRTAVVVRCWDDYLFREDDIANIRAMITELTLASGGRYDVHLLVQVKNDAHHPIWADHEAYEKRIRDSIPQELQGLVTLWTETQMLSLYQGIYDLWSRGPELPVHGWEMDIRYTGHYYDLVTKLEEWAKAQPRKGLWERNSRFYFPAAHGSWEDFSQMSRVQSEMGAAGSDNVWNKAPGVGGKAPEAASKKGRTVWGPQRPLDTDDWFEPESDDMPPTSYEADRYQWGVGEEADYISLNPLFDPEGTTWMLRDDITGFNRSRGLLPRRAAIITTSRMSRRLLMTMHRMTAYKKQFAFPEMWPATVALHHGLKAVFAPHPVYVDRKWPVDFMAQTFNGGRDGSSGGSRTSIFGEREHNMHGLSWFYNSGFAPNLYRRWLGLKVNNDGGDEFETTHDGRMCLPPMLLHPVKDVELPIEAPPVGDDEAAETAPASDPTA
ncbi:Major facilitator superfamily transporter [Hirsutella rhossiliensis]|uniref:Major facilitator superfamily transporter n=1 Tax=Hirsutella rhossiliensis TaxID=111463 RepID=A0A9P8N9T5_9HYPO|nr:Major facilitator superfamily transporter [Hirsutella rhossiliensis]KAH0967242.1 Major facilitator superfamily transporter [Hirsutella rhossiliensis]